MIKYVFLDMDNTIAENQTCENVRFTKGLYLNKRPLQIMIQAITALYIDKEVYIMSRVIGGDEGKNEKIEWLRKHTPYLIQQRAPFLIDVNDTKTKTDYIIAFAMINKAKPEECLIIDDNKKTLQECKKHNIQVLYPQQVICDYEEKVHKELEELFNDSL